MWIVPQSLHRKIHIVQGIVIARVGCGGRKNEEIFISQTIDASKLIIGQGRCYRTRKILIIELGRHYRTRTILNDEEDINYRTREML